MSCGQRAPRDQRDPNIFRQQELLRQTADPDRRPASSGARPAAAPATKPPTVVPPLLDRRPPGPTPDMSPEERKVALQAQLQHMKSHRFRQQTATAQGMSDEQQLAAGCESEASARSGLFGGRRERGLRSTYGRSDGADRSDSGCCARRDRGGQKRGGRGEAGSEERRRRRRVGNTIGTPSNPSDGRSRGGRCRTGTLSAAASRSVEGQDSEYEQFGPFFGYAEDPAASPGEASYEGGINFEGRSTSSCTGAGAPARVGALRKSANGCNESECDLPSPSRGTSSNRVAEILRRPREGPQKDPVTPFHRRPAP